MSGISSSISKISRLLGTTRKDGYATASTGEKLQMVEDDIHALMQQVEELQTFRNSVIDSLNASQPYSYPINAVYISPIG